MSTAACCEGPFLLQDPHCSFPRRTSEPYTDEGNKHVEKYSKQLFVETYVLPRPCVNGFDNVIAIFKYKNVTTVSTWANFNLTSCRSVQTAHISISYLSLFNLEEF